MINPNCAAMLAVETSLVGVQARMTAASYQTMPKTASSQYLATTLLASLVPSTAAQS